MPSINMIAPRRAEKRRLELDMRRLLIVIVAELVFALVLGGWVATKMFTTRCKIADLDVKITKCQPAVRQIARYEAATAQLTPKLDLLNQAKSGTMRWYNVLDRMASSMPSSTWLTRIGCAAQKEGESVGLNLSGVAVSQEKVGEAMMRLASSADFESIDLHFTQKAAMGTATAFEFEIGAAMKSANDGKGVSVNGTGPS